MAEYVSKEAAMDAGTLSDWYINSIDETKPPVWTEEHIEEILRDFLVIPKNTPTADVRPERHGRWKLDLLGRYYCSECESVSMWKEDDCVDGFDYDAMTYCSFCGAKMDGGAENG